MYIVNAISTALSGLSDASYRVNNSARNIANIRSVAAPDASSPPRSEDGTPLYKATQVQSETTPYGGVRSNSLVVYPVSVQLYDPSAADADGEGFVNRPNVNLEEEIVNQVFAANQYAANAAVIKTADDLSKELIDILA